MASRPCAVAPWVTVLSVVRPAPSGQRKPSSPHRFREAVLLNVGDAESSWTGSVSRCRQNLLQQGRWGPAFSQMFTADGRTKEQEAVVSILMAADVTGTAQTIGAGMTPAPCNASARRRSASARRVRQLPVVGSFASRLYSTLTPRWARCRSGRIQWPFPDVRLRCTKHNRLERAEGCRCTGSCPLHAESWRSLECAS